MTSIGIGIPVYNDNILIHHLLDSIMLYTDRKLFDIVVLDDGSTNDNKETVKKMCKIHDVEIIYNESNLGIAKSWNRLVRYLNTDYVILLNSDIIVYHKWFEVMKYFLENNPNIGTVSLPTLIVNKEDVYRIIQNSNKRCVEILNPYNRKKRADTFNLPESRHPVRLMSPIGCSFGFSRKMYDTVLGFHETYYAFYEEIDFGISLYIQGHPSIILPYPHIYHIWGATFQTNPQINAQHIMNESREKFMVKYGGDQIDIFKKLDHSFETIVTYLDNDIHKTVTIKDTYSPESEIEW